MGKNTPMIRVRPEDLEFLAEEQKRLEKIWGKIPRTFVISDLIRDRKMKRETRKKGKGRDDNIFGL